MNKTITAMLAGAACTSAWWLKSIYHTKETELLAVATTAVIVLWVLWETIMSWLEDS